ncbi:MAG: hypothetical protein M1828_004951 [Chrysothrix sp. TS-e1954]|nr:MAG: hypothetical protein M1828_004951 [Chrysothrix sp. TS-e1954]
MDAQNHHTNSLVDTLRQHTQNAFEASHPQIEHDQAGSQQRQEDGNPSHSMQPHGEGVSPNQMIPPERAVYASIDELLTRSNAFAVTQGYKLVVVRSKTNNQGQKIWVQLACDRHGIKRNTHNLTEETRKKNRRSRRCECPMYCVATKTGGGLWEFFVRNADHNHGPNQPKQKPVKEVPPPQNPSELVNLPLLQTPNNCIADFCLVPIGTASASVSAEIAEVHRLLKRTGLEFTLHSAGTTVEGSWDEVTRVIGQCHSLVHGSGVVRINTDIRIGTRTDKKQTARDKVTSVEQRLTRQPQTSTNVGTQQQEGDDTMADETDMTDPAIQQMSQAMAPLQQAIAVDGRLNSMGGQGPPMGHPLGHGMNHHPMAPQLPHHMGGSRLGM